MEPFTYIGGLFIAAVVGPGILAVLQGRREKSATLLNWKREDRVAALAAEAAQQTHSTLSVIHTLVNSNLTAAMRAELEATEGQASVMAELVDLRRANGQSPSRETLAAVEAKNFKVEELKKVLLEREKQQAVADAKDLVHAAEVEAQARIENGA